jgi:pilus assembly protein HofO
MSKLFHRWLSCSLWLQAGSVSLFFSLLAGLLWGGWGAPLQQNGLRLIQLQRQQTDDYQRLMHSLAAKGTLAGIASEIAQLRQAVEPDGREVFSLQRLTEVTKSSLAEWQPASQGGSLALLLNWPQVESVFGYLSSLPTGVALPDFTLQPEKQQLRLHLSLAVKDES